MITVPMAASGIHRLDRRWLYRLTVQMAVVINTIKALTRVIQDEKKTTESGSSGTFLDQEEWGIIRLPAGTLPGIFGNVPSPISAVTPAEHLNGLQVVRVLREDISNGYRTTIYFGLSKAGLPTR